MDINRNLFINNNYDDVSAPTGCKVVLKNKNLWQKFHELETEMIITKAGRRMFPSLHIQLYGLDPHAHYCILLELTPASHCRYKYSSSGGWAPTGAEEAQSPQRVYLHPESPSTGEYWSSQPISFGRMKLTNTPAPPPGHVVLSSMHKYQPRIIIAKTSDPRAVAWSPSIAVVFPETQFIAVTAYQNERITKLKIDNNPFAKGFRENGQSKCKRKRVIPEVGNDETVKKAVTEILSTYAEEENQDSSPGSPEPSPKRSSSSPKCPTVSRRLENYPVPIRSGYSSMLPTHVLCPYYCPQYPINPIWGAHFSYQAGLVRSQAGVVPVPEKKPKKLTDFSIRAITGCS